MLRVAVGDRQRRDLQDRLGFFAGQALGVLGGAHARRQRIARIERHVLDRAALDALRRPLPALGPHVVAPIAVVARVRIDQAADRAVLLRELGLEAPPAAAVAGDDDLALDADAPALERLVVVGHAVVDVDQLGGDVAVALVGEVGGKRAGRVARRAVAVDLALLQGGDEMLGPDQLDGLRDRGWIEDLEFLDVGVPAPGLVLRQHPLGVGLVVGRADLVGGRGHLLEPTAHLGRIELAVEGLHKGVARRTRSRLGLGMLGRGRSGAGVQGERSREGQRAGAARAPGRITTKLHGSPPNPGQLKRRGRTLSTLAPPPQGWSKLTSGAPRCDEIAVRDASLRALGRKRTECATVNCPYFTAPAPEKLEADASRSGRTKIEQMRAFVKLRCARHVASEPKVAPISTAASGSIAAIGADAGSGQF